MIVTKQKIGIPDSVFVLDFKFIEPMLEIIQRLPMKDKVWFPMPNRGAVEANLDIHFDYKYGYHGKFPFAEITFINRHHGLQMAHTAVVRPVVEDGVLMYNLEIKPNKRLRSNGHRTVETKHASAQACVKTLMQSYGPGAYTRKVIPFVKVEVAA